MAHDKTQEALKLALEAFEAKGDAWIVLERKAKAAIREALAEQPAHCEAGPDYCQICSDEQVQDILKIGNPTEEEYRLIRLGWDAAMRLAEQPAQQQEPIGWEYVVQLLIAAGYVSQEKVDHACTIAKAQQQEPVAIVDASDDGYWAEILPDRNVKVGQLLYPSPPANANADKPWVGLTDEEIEQCMKQAYATVQGRNLEHAFAHAIEAKLREKNA